MDLKIMQSLLERVKICKRCWKTEGSNKGLENKNTVFLFKGTSTFELGHFHKFSYFFFCLVDCM